MQYQNHFGESNFVSCTTFGGGGTSRSFGNVVDLTNYHTKGETDSLLLPKANLTTGGKHVDEETNDLAITNVFQVTWGHGGPKGPGGREVMD